MASARSRLVAATIRTSTVRGRVDPTRKNMPVSSARSSFTWLSGSISPISSRRSVPPSARSMSPGLAAMALVNARALREDPAERPRAGGVRAQRLVVAQQLTLLGRLAHDDVELLDLRRLREVIVGAELHRLH